MIKKDIEGLNTELRQSSTAYSGWKIVFLTDEKTVKRKWVAYSQYFIATTEEFNLTGTGSEIAILETTFEFMIL